MVLALKMVEVAKKGKIISKGKVASAFQGTEGSRL